MCTLYSSSTCILYCCILYQYRTNHTYMNGFIYSWKHQQSERQKCPYDWIRSSGTRNGQGWCYSTTLLEPPRPYEYCCSSIYTEGCVRYVYCCAGELLYRRSTPQVLVSILFFRCKQLTEAFKRVYPSTKYFVWYFVRSYLCLMVSTWQFFEGVYSYSGVLCTVLGSTKCIIPRPTGDVFFNYSNKAQKVARYTRYTAVTVVHRVPGTASTKVRGNQIPASDSTPQVTLIGSRNCYRTVVSHGVLSCSLEVWYFTNVIKKAWLVHKSPAGEQ